MKCDVKIVAGRTLHKAVDAKERRRKRDQLGRKNLHDWYIRKLLAKKLSIPTHELPEALILAKRQQLMAQRLDEVDGALAIHRSKYTLYMADQAAMPDPP